MSDTMILQPVIVKKCGWERYIHHEVPHQIARLLIDPDVLPTKKWDIVLNYLIFVISDPEEWSPTVGGAILAAEGAKEDALRDNIPFISKIIYLEIDLENQEIKMFEPKPPPE